MINISDSTSIFEIIFAINAVFFVIASRYRENIEHIYEHIKAEMKLHDMNTELVRAIHIRTAAYAVFPVFKRVNIWFFGACTLLSIAGTTLSLGLLIWHSFEPIQISATFYIIILVLFCLVSPAHYLLFSFWSNYVIDRICATRAQEDDLRTILLIADTEQLLEDVSKTEMKFAIQEAQRAYRATKVFVLETINPFFRIKKRKRDYERAKEAIRKRRRELELAKK